ncbi:unnamed protein product [Ilex paraguariensis]|uniref:Uncharacterized protein n=1 Tax=Ilex paraguariensis TaxID=185542 RepID=A0ABC8SXR4_9AQUA
MRNPSKPSSKSGGGAGSSGSSTNSKTTPCCIKVGLKRGPWTPEEDELLANYIRREGEGRWRTMPKKAGLLRCGKSCRLRWMNYLRPSVKRGHIAPDEEDLILRLHRLLGNRWSLIAGRIPGRTDNEIKNYWNTHLSKKLISQGIDPRTHKPLNTNISDKASSSNAYHSSHYDANLVLSSLEEAQTDGPTIVNSGNKTCNRIDLDQYNSVASENGDDDDDDDDDINYCTATDDVFSSFLNSLINEDGFNCQNQVEQQETNMIANGSDVLITSTQTFAFGDGWDAPIMSSASASAFSHKDSKKLNEHLGKHL